MRTFHRIVGIVVAAQIAVWVATGMLFNAKLGYDETYETLRSPRAPLTAGENWVTPADAVAAAGGGERVDLLQDARGALYVVSGAGGASLVDAHTGAVVPPLDASGAEALLQGAVAGSKHADRYGAVVSSTPAALPSGLIGRETPGWTLALDTGQTVTVNAVTAEIAHESWLNTWIDWTYRAHYMQYTPWKSVNIAVVTVFSILVFALVASGVNVFFEKSRKYGRSSRQIRL